MWLIFTTHPFLFSLIRLHQRGGKTLKERTRSQQIEIRLKDISKDIASIRRQLTSKPF